MRKLVIAALALVAATAMAAIAYAQKPAPVMTGAFKVTPSKAGTKEKPTNALFQATANVNPESESTLDRLEFTVPKDIKVNGKGFPTCSADRINANGDDGCPKPSKVGTGAATALLGPDKSQLNFVIEIYAAGPKSLAIYLQTSLFNIAIPATINGQVVGVDIPERVQQPVGGLYAYITSVTAKLGKQTGIKAKVKTGKGKKRKTRYFASSVGCPGGKHSAKVKGFLTPNPEPPPVPTIEASGKAPCSK